MTALLDHRDTRLRVWWWSHPELPWLAVSAIAWCALGWQHLLVHDTDTTTLPSDMHLLWWTAMVAAMMIPALVPMQRRVSLDSLWARRHRTAALFVSTYACVWTAFGAGLLVIVRIGEELAGARFAPGRSETAVVATIAVAWQFTRTKSKAARRCHRRRALAPAGWRSNADLVRHGTDVGAACVVSCWPVMALMYVAAHDLHAMVPLAMATIVERWQTRPSAAVGAGLVGAGGLLLVLPIA